LFDNATDPCQTGGDSYLAIEAFIRKGAKMENYLPYNTSLLNCAGNCQCDNCPPVKRFDVVRLVTNSVSNIDLIKQAIYSNGPITGSFYYNLSYLYTDATSGYFYDCNSVISLNHLISIVSSVS
jgi:hypothetical protein